ncbi:MAG TPA: hypothetical protein VEH76_09940 [Methylocystis sp.]|nr:hypothetical protein [Methylocystis sp.]
MITLRRCASLAGLNLDELVIGVAPAARHETLLQSYLLNMHRGRVAVRKMIVCDLLGYLDIGAHRLAADLLVVLRLFLSDENQIAAPRPDRRPAGEPSGLAGRARAPRHAAPAPFHRKRAAAPLAGAMR